MIRIIGSTDPGLVRANNQDRFEFEILSGNLSFAVLCDGMGGENGGQVASKLASEFAKDILRRDLHESMGETSMRAVLMSVFSGANAVVREAAKKDESLKGMGTTMIVAVVSGHNLYAAYVGDSRIYCSSEGGESQLSRDHTMVQILVDIGEITMEDAALHPKRHYITRAVGVSDTIDAEFLLHTLSKGDIILLCSDGLYQYLEPGAMRPLLLSCLEQDSAAPMIELAKSCGGTDNITAVILA